MNRRADRADLGAALRQWRARLRPADVGLPANMRRRTPGLRREEVAHLAGVSADYVAQLEQGRGSRPSESVLAGLAMALRLSEAERAHLFALAGMDLPLPGVVDDAVRPGVLRLMDRLSDLPAMLLNARLDVLAWNPLAAALLGDFSTVPPCQRNVARLRWLGIPVTDRALDDPRDPGRLDRAMVADLRAAATRYPDDKRLRRLIVELRAGNATFARLWGEREMVTHHDECKRFAHPEVGELELDCQALAVPRDQVLVVFSADPSSADASALALLNVLGTSGTATLGIVSDPR